MLGLLVPILLFGFAISPFLEGMEGGWPARKQAVHLCFQWAARA